MDNPRSPRARAVAKLAKKSRRQEAKLFLVEGPQAVREALSYQPSRVVELFVTESGYSRNADIVALAKEHSVELTEVSDQVLEVMTDTSTPQGVLAVVEMLEQDLATVLSSHPDLLVVLDRVADPGNAGTIIRVAAAAGADAVVVCHESVDVYNPKVVRSTTGSLFHIPVITDLHWRDAVGMISKAGIHVLAAAMSGEPLPEVAASGRLDRPTAWLFGNEAHGLDPAAIDLADIVVSVPQYGPVESMNLATAAAVCLYQSAFAHHRAER
jgi:TrmH family RNA methyltransferase